MTRNERWLNMLKMMNIEATNDILTGELVNRVLLNDNKTWRITLEFDNLLSVERINFLTSSIRKYLQEEIGTEECKFSVIYRNSILDGLNNILIAEYFEEAIRVLSTVKREITIIRKYPFELVTNEIMISVGTEMEKAVVDAQCKLIKKL